MALTLIPANTGGGSAVGFAREDTWGTPPTSAAADPNKAFGSVSHPAHFLAMKEESFEPNVDAEPQLDDLDQDRQVSRVIDNGNSNAGSLRAHVGPESIGWFFTMLFGTPTTTTVLSSSGSYDAVYQHIWYPGVNAARSAWPAPFSIESRLDTIASKLIMGALINKLGIEIGNNAAVIASADFIAKAMQILGAAGTSGTNDDEGVARPCILTASPTFIDETPWHFKHIKAYPTIDGSDATVISSLGYDFDYPDLHGIFTGGSGANIGTYGVDKFQHAGRCTMLFENDDMWYKIKQGAYFALISELEGATIQGESKFYLKIESFSCKAAQPGLANRVGDLAYDFAFQTRKDPVTGLACRITLKNSVSTYAA